MAPDEDSNPLKPGSLIDGKYEVRRLLGQGGMGSVFEATHLLRQARVALKFMSPHLLEIKGIVERFLNEGIAASRINSEHVVKVLDVSKLQSGQPYLVMEFLDGEDLESLLAREGQTGIADIPRAVHFILQVLRGLQVAHSAGIIHRDLKPANCFVVAQDGEPDFIKLVDFGISKVQAGDGNVALTYEGSTMGTPLYVSLEQARNAANVDERSDLYSVAVMLYELLCGHTPFLPTNMADLLYQLAAGTPPPLDEQRPLPSELAAVVHKGLARDREHRYQSAADFALALVPFADDRSAFVLRQLAQRGSVQPSRPPPAYSSASPALARSNAPRVDTTPNPPAAAARSATGRHPSLGESSGAASHVSGAQISPAAVGHLASSHPSGQQTPTGTLITHELTESIRMRAQAATQVAPNAESAPRSPNAGSGAEAGVKSATSSPVTRTGPLGPEAPRRASSASRLWVPLGAAAITAGGIAVYFTSSHEPNRATSNPSDRATLSSLGATAPVLAEVAAAANSTEQSAPRGATEPQYPTAASAAPAVNAASVGPVSPPRPVPPVEQALPDPLKGQPKNPVHPVASHPGPARPARPRPELKSIKIDD